MILERRQFIALVCGAAAWPSIARAQQPVAKVHRVAFIASNTPVPELLANPNPAIRAFVQGLRDLGYIEGKNLVLEWRSAEGRYERFPEITRELLSLNVDVIVSIINPSILAAKNLTGTVPIVMIAANPVQAGFVESLARPGGKITGLTWEIGFEIIQKHVQFLKDLLPAMSYLAFLWPEKQWDPGNARGIRQSIEQAARLLGLRLLFAEPIPTNYADALALIERERPDALLVAPGNAQFTNRRLIVEFAARNRLPAMYPFVEAVREGGLMGHGVDFPDLFRRLAQYVDKILKGAKPADLAVEQPTKFQLAINLKTAKALGLDVPPTLLARADEVIE